MRSLRTLLSIACVASSIIGFKAIAEEAATEAVNTPVEGSQAKAVDNTIAKYGKAYKGIGFGSSNYAVGEKLDANREKYGNGKDNSILLAKDTGSVALGFMRINDDALDGLVLQKCVIMFDHGMFDKETIVKKISDEISSTPKAFEFKKCFPFAKPQEIGNGSVCLPIPGFSLVVVTEGLQWEGKNNIVVKMNTGKFIRYDIVKDEKQKDNWCKAIKAMASQEDLDKTRNALIEGYEGKIKEMKEKKQFNDEFINNELYCTGLLAAPDLKELDFYPLEILIRSRINEQSDGMTAWDKITKTPLIIRESKEIEKMAEKYRLDSETEKKKKEADEEQAKKKAAIDF